MSPPSGTSAPTGSGRSRPADQPSQDPGRLTADGRDVNRDTACPTAWRPGGVGAEHELANLEPHQAGGAAAQRLFDDLVRVALKEARLQHAGQTFDSGMQSMRNLRELRVEHEKP